MISLFAILLLAIAGASAECIDANMYTCYVPYFNIMDMDTFCKELPSMKKCIVETNCTKTAFDKYMLSLVQSDGTSCNVCKVIKCSRQILMSGKNMTFCRAISAITKCHTDNKCNNVVKEYPTFFNICDSKNENNGLKLGSQLFQKLKAVWAAKKAQRSTTAKPAKK